MGSPHTALRVSADGGMVGLEMRGSNAKRAADVFNMVADSPTVRQPDDVRSG